MINQGIKAIIENIDESIVIGIMSCWNIKIYLVKQFRHFGLQDLKFTDTESF